MLKIKLKYSNVVRNTQLYIIPRILAYQEMLEKTITIFYFYVHEPS